MKTKKMIAFLLMAAVVVFLFSGKSIVNASSDEASNQGAQMSQDVFYTQEDVANLVKPSVVRIVQHVKGKITVYPFDIDLKKMEIVTVPGKPVTQDIDKYISGSGVIVNPDGYILTNSHVVSNSSIKYQLATTLLALTIYDKADSLKDSGDTKLLENEEKLQQFIKEAITFLIDKNKFEIEKTVTVLDPSSSKSTLLDLIADGFMAKMVSVNDNFYKDGYDAAVIKVEQNNLPSLKLGNSANINTGEKIYVFGYPGNADFNGKNLLEPTFTQGIINGVKNSDNNSFKIFQTDAKISSGSSGGPLLNNRGEIIGLVTYASGLSANAGDSFAFAIPIDTVPYIINSNYVQDNQVSFENGNFSTHFNAALANIQAKKCETALEELILANNVNEKFQPLLKLNSYQDNCKSIIAAGQSIDTKAGSKDIKSDEKSPTMAVVKKYTPWIIAGIAGIVVLFVLVSIIFLLKKLKKDEEKISELESEYHIENISHDEPGSSLVDDNESEPRSEKNILLFNNKN